jgi:hypothetical protein
MTEEFRKYIKKLSDLNGVSTSDIKKMFMREIDYESKRLDMKETDVEDNVFRRIKEWVEGDYELIITPKHIVDYRPTYLFFTRCMWED